MLGDLILSIGDVAYGAAAAAPFKVHKFRFERRFPSAKFQCLDVNRTRTSGDADAVPTERQLKEGDSFSLSDWRAAGTLLSSSLGRVLTCSSSAADCTAGGSRPSASQSAGRV